MADLILKPSSGSGNKVRIQDQTGSDNLIIDADASMTGVKPHIIPGVLYPSYVASGTSNKLLDGSTSHSGAFGTEQSDGRKYYYTNIAGSKPIKDPRIGAHFGSQRHKFKSLQLLEQETATHGSYISSIDGREWARTISSVSTEPSVQNDASGVGLVFDPATANEWIEITGYFNQANLLAVIWSNSSQDVNIYIDGTDTGNDANVDATVNNPLGSRFVDSCSVVNMNLGSISLGIHTLKIGGTTTYWYPSGIELIAQDTQDFTATNATNILTTTGHTLTNGDQIRLTGSDLPNGLNTTTTYYVISVSGNNFQVSTSSGGSAVTFSDDGSGTRTWTALNNIQIPAQTVVSYGKKFTIDAQSTHYDPFNGFTNDTTLFSSRVDVATSLGLGTATTWGAAWDKGSNNHIRPYNGGRVVKWVDASGNIKTSVTMMPANAQNISTTASNEITTPSATNTTTTPNMSNDAIEHSLSEVAKTFHFREFGNGSANGNTGAGSYPDASMLSSSSYDIAYVMDDGLTCLVANNGFITNETLGVSGASDSESYLTFIGTGLGYHAPSASASYNSLDKDVVVQNLPYGTHVIRNGRNDGAALNNVDVDGIEVYDDNSAIQGIEYIDIFQPKKPPIPEEAVVLADYCVYADFVKKGTAGIKYISKGTRRVHASRDFFYNNATFSASFVDASTANGGYVYFNGTPSSGTNNPSLKVPVFATNGTATVNGGLGQWWVDGVSTADSGSTAGNNGAYLSLDSDQILGVHVFEIKGIDSSTNSPWCSGIDVASPIHTSSHYQEFEDPLLKTLVGGDRNMEQHNLIVTPDGKSWDQLTRDTSYLGNLCLQSTALSTYGVNVTVILDEWRGKPSSVNRTSSNKYFAIAYDRMICLVDGQYQIQVQTIATAENTPGNSAKIYINGTNAVYGHSGASGYSASTSILATPLIRGDYVQVKGGWYSSHGYSNFSIIKIK